MITAGLADRSPAALRRLGRAVRGAGMAGASLAGDLAAHAGKATVRPAAKNTEYPRLTSSQPAARGHGGPPPCSPSPSRQPSA